MKAFLEKIARTIQGLGLPFKLGMITNISRLVIKSRLRVGKTYAFTYKGQTYVVIVISSERAPLGFLTSQKGNLLLSCLKLDLISESDQTILSAIYKRESKKQKQKIADYSVMRDKSSQLEDIPVEEPLTIYFSKKNRKVNYALFGKDNFRTFIVNEISNLKNLRLDIRYSDYSESDE